jgi:hypothetical protein
LSLSNFVGDGQTNKLTNQPILLLLPKSIIGHDPDPVPSTFRPHSLSP